MDKFEDISDWMTQSRIIYAPNLQHPAWYLVYGVKLISSFQSLSRVSLQPYGLQHARPSCPSPTPRVYSNSCPLSCWCHPTISSSVAPFSSCPQSFPASGSVPMSQLFISGGQSIGTSASAPVLPMNIQEREHKLSQKRTTGRFSFLFKILPN